MFNTKEKFSLRKLKNGKTVSARIGIAILGLLTMFAMNTEAVYANSDISTDTTVENVLLEDNTTNEILEEKTTDETTITTEAEEILEDTTQSEIITLGEDVSERITNKSTNSQIVGYNTEELSHVSLFYNEYTGSLDNSNKDLKSGDYFKITLDEKVGLDGITVYDEDYSARPSEEITDNSNKTILKNFYNKDDHSLYYVFTEEASKLDTVDWTLYTTDTVNYKKQTTNGTVNFTNNYAGSEVNYSGKVNYKANYIREHNDYGFHVNHEIVEADVVKQKYTQMFSILPMNSFENSSKEIKLSYVSKSGITPAKDLKIKVFSISQDQQFLDSFHVSPEYKEITNETVKNNEIVFSKGFSTGEKYLIQLENSYSTEKGLNSGLEGFYFNGNQFTFSGILSKLDSKGYSNFTLNIKKLPKDSLTLESKPELDISVSNLLGEKPPVLEEKLTLDISVSNLFGEVPPTVEEKTQLDISLNNLKNELPPKLDEKPVLDISVSNVWGETPPVLEEKETLELPVEKKPMSVKKATPVKEIPSENVPKVELPEATLLEGQEALTIEEKPTLELPTKEIPKEAPTHQKIELVLTNEVSKETKPVSDKIVNTTEVSKVENSEESSIGENYQTEEVYYSEDLKELPETGATTALVGLSLSVGSMSLLHFIPKKFK